MSEVKPGHCLQCGYSLGDSPSPDFCSPSCQSDWYSEHVGVQRLDPWTPDAALVPLHTDAARWYPPGADEGDWSVHVTTNTGGAVRAVTAAMERFGLALVDGLEQIAAALPAPARAEALNPPPEGQDTREWFREALRARQVRNTGPEIRPGRRVTDRPRDR